MTQDEITFEKIEKLIPNFETFENRIISTEEFKRLLNNNYLGLLNDIYRTRISVNASTIILERLDKVTDFNEYEVVLKQFEDCNPRKNDNVNALSLGTKVLHTYNPEENPILDSVIRKNLKLKSNLDIDTCLDFRKAMTRFANKYKGYFSSFRKSNRIKQELEEYHLKSEFPKMKILDMVIYYEG